MANLILLAFAFALAQPINGAEAGTNQEVAEPSLRAELIDARRIWNAAPHSAFTSLVRHEGRFYCGFREGRGHASTDGRLRVLASEDGVVWESVGLLEREGLDLRDAHLTVMPDGALLLLGGAAARRRDGESTLTGTVVSVSADGRSWSAPELVVEPGRWLWSVAWHDSSAWGFAYSHGEEEAAVHLMRSPDGRTFETHVEGAYADLAPNEVALAFEPDGRARALVRRGGGDRLAALGSSAPPYREWTWQPLAYRVGGPVLLRLPDGHWIGAGRLHADGAHTALFALDFTTGALTPLLRLPSGGDNSYPGLVVHDGLLWLSYYSSHEGRTSIYLARVKLAGGPR